MTTSESTLLFCSQSLRLALDHIRPKQPSIIVLQSLHRKFGLVLPLRNITQIDIRNANLKQAKQIKKVAGPG